MKGRWRESLSMLADVVTVASGVALLAGSLGLAVGSLSRTWTLVILVGLAAVFGVLVWARWDKWWKAIRPRYVSAVVWLAKWVREDVLDRLRGEGATWEELREAVGYLSEVAAEVLRIVLRGHEPRSDGWVVIKPVHKPLRDRKRPETKPYIDDVINACDELKRAGFLSEVEELEGDAWVRVLLSDTVRDGLVLKLDEEVGRHLVNYIRFSPDPDEEPRVWGIEAGPAHSSEEG